MPLLDITRMFQPCKHRSNPDASLDVRFLDLMASSPASFFVPTLDIDLVWHTHQLFADRYRTHCDIYVAKFVDQSVVFVLTFAIAF